MLKNVSIFGKKTVSLLLASLFLFSTGCGARKDPADLPKDSTAASKESNGREKLVIGISANQNVIDFETNKFTRLIEEKNNVDLEFILFPTDQKDVKTKIALMVSSQSKLPDVFAMDSAPAWDDLTIMDYGNKGVIIDALPYLNDPAITPNFNAVPADIKKFAIDNSQFEGKVYGFPKYVPQYWNEGFHRAWVNKEWLEKLGIKEPKTTEEFREMLRRFANEDPNGNGKKDEIALVGNKYDSGWGNQVNDFLMGAFTYVNPDRQYLHVKDGKIYPSFTQEEWKEGLEYMNSLVEEGLLSPLSYTQDNAQLKALATSEVAVTGVVLSGTASIFGSQDSPQAQRMTLLGPLEGPKGENNTPYAVSPSILQWFVTKDCANPELAMKVADSMWDYETSMLSRYGEKGVNWDDNPEVTKLWSPEQEGKEVKWVQIPDANIWGQPQNTHWQGKNPTYIPIETVMTMGFVPLDELATTKKINYQPTYMKEYVSHAPKENITRLVYTPEDLEKISSSRTAIDDYVKISLAEFINGTRPLKDWDNYLKDLDNMGLANYIETAQIAYDRNK